MHPLIPPHHLLLLEQCLEWFIGSLPHLTASSGLAASLTWPKFSHIIHKVLPAASNLYLPVAFARGVLWTFQSTGLYPLSPSNTALKTEPIAYSFVSLTFKAA